MLLRLALFIVLGVFVARAFWRLVDGIAAGVRGGPAQGEGPVPSRGVHMVRDPVCGTYVIPDRAVTLSDGSSRVFFCSANCRDKYRARPSAPSTDSGSPRATSPPARGEPVEGRTA